MHCFEGFEGDISLDTLNAAMLIVDTASQCFVNIFTPPSELYEANLLDSWFTQKYRQYGVRYASKSLVRRISKPMYRAVRPDLHRAEVMNHLIDQIRFEAAQPWYQRYPYDRKYEAKEKAEALVD